MKKLEVDDAAPQFKMGAAIDAQQEHKKYWPTHTVSKQQQATCLQQLAYSAFGMLGSRVYVNAREKFIVVKVDKPSVKVQWVYPNELAAMHAFVASNGIEPVATKNNLVFRIPK